MKVLTSSILFSTAIRAAVVAKPETQSISLLTSFISASGTAVVAKLVTSVVLFSIPLIFALWSV